MAVQIAEDGMCIATDVSEGRCWKSLYINCVVYIANQRLSLKF